MFDSFSGAEILTIAVIALVVFGPQRLPEIARTIGGYLRELRAAVTELRRGIEQEIGPIRDPIKDIKQDLAKPVSDIRQTLAQTADAAKSAERDIKRSATKPITGSSGTTGPSRAPRAGTDSGPTEARWIAPEPPTGVSPSDAWEGMGDPMPGSVHPAEPADPSPDAEKVTARDSVAGEEENLQEEEVTERDDP